MEERVLYVCPKCGIGRNEVFEIRSNGNLYTKDGGRVTGMYCGVCPNQGTDYHTTLLTIEEVRKNKTKQFKTKW